MRLDISIKQEHSDIVTAIAWSPDNQLLSCSDDKVIGKWGADGEKLGQIANVNVFASAISWLPSSGKQTSDTFAISCTDGTMRFIARSGREEKKVQAHEGATILIRWSRDGSAILTAGEDGDVKLWSKSGNLRSLLASLGQSVYCACWGPDDDQILIGNGKSLMIKSVQANKKNLQWVAHDGIILCADWNIANGNIISGGEDCNYKVWDSFGRQLYSSRPMEQVVTSIAWCPNGECFAVGSYNIIRLCDRTGWTHSRERLQSGSILSIAWTSDGTQFACAGGNSSVVFAQVVDRKFEWKNSEVTLLEPRKIRVQDVANESTEDLEFSRDRVVEIGLGFEYLVVTTTTQCFVYNLGNLNTPIIFDIKAPPHFIHICRRHFLTLDSVSGICIVSFEGRVLCAPKFQGMRTDYITKEMVTLSPDTLCVVDSNDAKIIQLIDASIGKNINRLTHNAEVTHVQLNQHCLGTNERILVYSDRNRDLFTAALFSSGAYSAMIPTYKLLANVESFAFNDDTNVLVGLADGRLKLWYQPEVVFVDRDLLSTCTVSQEVVEYGRSAQVVAYTGNRISIRKVDGSILFTSTSPDISLLYQLSRASKWEECVRLCRHQRDEHLWATLASMAISKRQLDTAEQALAEINEVTKVEYIQYVKGIPSEEGQQAELALYRRQPEEAERILLQASPPLVYRAIKLNLNIFRWDRALELSLKHREHLETVLGYRQKYLDDFQREEKHSKYLSYFKKVNFDWNEVMQNEARELEDEYSREKGRK